MKSKFAIGITLAMLSAVAIAQQNTSPQPSLALASSIGQTQQPAQPGTYQPHPGGRDPVEEQKERRFAAERMKIAQRIQEDIKRMQDRLSCVEHAHHPAVLRACAG